MTRNDGDEVREGVASTLESKHPAQSSGALGLMPGVFFGGVAGGLVLPVLTAIAMRTHVSTLVFGLIVGANRFSRLVSAPIVGSLADRLASRSLFLLGLAVQILSLILFTMALHGSHAVVLLFVGRLLTGASSAFLNVSAQALALNDLQEERRAPLASALRATTGVGLPMGVALSAFLGRTEERTVMLLSLAALLVSLALAFRFLRGHDESSAKVISVAPIPLAQKRAFFGLSLLNFAVSFSSLGVTMTVLPRLLAERPTLTGGRSETSAIGLLMVPLVLGMAGATFLSGRARGRGSRVRARLIITTAIISVAPLSLSHSSNTIWFAFTMLALGAACGVVSATLVSVVDQEHRRKGSASGWLQVAGDLGGIAGPALVVAIASRGSDLTLKAAATASFAVMTFGLFLLSRRPSTAEET